MNDFDLDGFSIDGSVGPGLENRARDMVQVGNALERTAGFTPYANAPYANAPYAKAPYAKAPASNGPGDTGDPRDSLFAGSVMGFQAQTGHDPDGALLPDGPTRRSMATAMTRRKGRLRDAAPTASNLPKGGLLDSGLAPVAKPPAVRKAVGAGRRNDRGDVRAIRSNLSRIGFGQRAVEVRHPGRFDDNLAKGMKRFQAAKGLKVDGTAIPGGPTETALRQQVGRQQAAVKQTYEKEAAVLRDLLGAIGPALAGWRVGQRVAQEQNARRLSVGLPPAADLLSKEDGTIMNARRTVLDGNAPAGSGKGAMAIPAAAPSAATKPAAARNALEGRPATGPKDGAAARRGGDGKAEPAQARKADEDKAAEIAGKQTATASTRYTVRHEPNTRWTAKGTIWTPANGKDGIAAATPPAKREIYVGKFLHDRAQEALGLNHWA